MRRPRAVCHPSRRQRRHSSVVLVVRDGPGHAGMCGVRSLSVGLAHLLYLPQKAYRLCCQPRRISMLSFSSCVSHLFFERPKRYVYQLLFSALSLFTSRSSHFCPLVSNICPLCRFCSAPNCPLHRVRSPLRLRRPTAARCWSPTPLSPPAPTASHWQSPIG